MGAHTHDTRRSACFARATADELVRIYPHHTAKHVARDLGCTPKAAANLLDGHLSAASVAKLIAAYGPGWVAERVLEAAGQSLESYIEQQATEAEAAAAQAREAAQKARARYESYAAARRGNPGDHGARP